mmetsp:Transcript_123184/g.213610  ORF Transcript_123184/g.213610 Transcript_123184/m.213610 type:complete len:85 (-) Transcript_123184:115-369(-)
MHRLRDTDWHPGGKVQVWYPEDRNPPPPLPLPFSLGLVLCLADLVLLVLFILKPPVCPTHKPKPTTSCAVNWMSTHACYKMKDI